MAEKTHIITAIHNGYIFSLCVILVRLLDYYYRDLCLCECFFGLCRSGEEIMTLANLVCWNLMWAMFADELGSKLQFVRLFLCISLVIGFGWYFVGMFTSPCCWTLSPSAKKETKKAFHIPFFFLSFFLASPRMIYLFLHITLLFPHRVRSVCICIVFMCELRTITLRLRYSSE